MSEKKTFSIEEQSGDQFPDLATAQQAARPELASILADMLRRMIESGALEIKDGLVLPKE